MAVTATLSAADGVYVPFRTRRTPANGLVGTLSMRTTVTGAAGGGTAAITFTMSRREFGFHAIWVPTIIQLHDNLATPEVVAFRYRAAGNERLQGDIQDTVTTVEANSVNQGLVSLRGVIIDPNVRVSTAVMLATWDTNTDTKVYALHAFGVVYDGEVLARRGPVAELMAGLT